MLFEFFVGCFLVLTNLDYFNDLDILFDIESILKLFNTKQKFDVCMP